MKKYEFTGETMLYSGVTVNRIRALRDIRYNGDSICVHAGELGGWIEKEGNLEHTGAAWVYDNAVVLGNAIVRGNATVADNAVILSNADISGDAWIYDYALVSDNAWISDSVDISGYARICGDAWILGNARVSDDALIYKSSDVLVIGPIGSRDDYTTFYRNCENGIGVSCGCFTGTIDKFIDRVKETHDGTAYDRDYLSAIEFAKFKMRG